MTLATPVDRVVEILKNAGYRQLKLPLTIASVPFDFAAALVGTGWSPDLIVVIDTIQESDARTRQKIDGLGRAMDVVGSRRPVTAVLAGPRPPDSTLDALARVCRVLPVGTPTGSNADALLHEWLSVLLPLDLPEPGELGADSFGELTKHLSESLDSSVRTVLLESAAHGEHAVRAALKHLVVEGLGGDQAAEGALS